MKIATMRFNLCLRMMKVMNMNTPMLAGKKTKKMTSTSRAIEFIE